MQLGSGVAVAVVEASSCSSDSTWELPYAVADQKKKKKEKGKKGKKKKKPFKSLSVQGVTALTMMKAYFQKNINSFLHCHIVQL